MFWLNQNEIEDRICDLTWYSPNDGGEMVAGAKDEDSAYYKATDIYEILRTVTKLRVEKEEQNG